MEKQAYTFKTNSPEICKACDDFETNPFIDLKNFVGYCKTAGADGETSPRLLDTFPEICTDFKAVMEGF